METDVGLDRVLHRFRPVVTSTREDLELAPTIRYRDIVRFGEVFSFTIRFQVE